MKRKKTKFIIIILVLIPSLTLIYNFIAHRVSALVKTPVYEQQHFWFLDDDGTGVNDASGWGSPDTAQDTSISDVSLGSSFRLRFAIDQTLNLGGGTFTPKLQYKVGGTAGDCTLDTWTDIPTETNCGTSPICQDTSAVFADGDLTTQRLDTDEFMGGDGIETDGTPDSVTFDDDGQAGEWEWMLQVTTNATENATYTIRVVHSDGTTLDTYTVCPTLTTSALNNPPTVSNVSLNGGNNITLTENATTLVTATATVSDADGYSDITQVIGRIFRLGVGENCTLDDNNCYEVTCSTSSCSGTDCQADCNFNVWFHADPTDIGSPWETEHWVAQIKVVDSQNASSSATNTTQTIEMNSLVALDVTLEINYGTMYPGETIDPLSIVSTVTTTGNVAIDVELSGTDLSSDGNTISVSQQHYATSSVAFSSGYALSTTPTALELSTGKPTSHPSDQFQNIYWGIQIPSGTSMGSYLGQITFTAISD
jgi:hypothetical protein